jgi:uncharacterized membrane protein
MDDRRISRTRIAYARVVTLLGLLIAGLAHAASSDPFYRTTFAPPDTIAEWTITAGSWRFSNQEFINSSAGPLSIATVHTYEPSNLAPATIGRDFSLDFYALIVSGAADARVGAVFDFADPGNYHEMTVSATGSAQLRSRIGGVSRIVGAMTFAAPGPDKWIHVTLVRNNGRLTVRIDGIPVFVNASQLGLPEGDMGLITRNTPARFDDLDVRSFGRQDPYIEDFNDGDADRWQPLSGTWTVTSEYRNSAVVATAITRAPLHDMWEVGATALPLPYTFRVRMLNPYGGSGNLVGIAWVRDAANYTEAVFSPTGQARLNKVANGVRSTIASASYLGGSPNQWFEVEVDHDGNPTDFTAVSHIKVNGVPIFDVAPHVTTGQLSLITHWSPAHFDDVRAAVRFFEPFAETFDGANVPPLVHSDTWVIENAQLTNSTIVAASRAVVSGSADWHELADIEFRARMINRFGASGNLVGFTYGARGPVYYEAVVAHLRKVVKGVPHPIATAQYEGGEPGQWFDAQLIQIDDHTTVKVNGVTVFGDVPQPDGQGGKLGFVAHWTNASVDDVSFTQIPVTRYRFTQLPDLTTNRDSGVRALNDRGDVVGASRSVGGRQNAVLWRGGRVMTLGALLGDGSLANDINNRSEIVGENLNSKGFYWKDGQLQDPFPECDRSEAQGINDSGQVVGICGAGGGGTAAVLREPDGRVRTLEQLPGGPDWSIAWAINERGEVAGESFGTLTFLEAVSWRDGMVEPLGVEGSAQDINNRGQMVGIVRTTPQPAVMWQERELLLLPSRVGQNHALAFALNEHGVVVGTTTGGDPADPNRPTVATLWQEGRVADLNELITCPSLPESTSLGVAMDINERGQIAVNGANDFAPGVTRAFVLTPVSRRENCGP